MDVFERAGRAEIPELHVFEERTPVATVRWEAEEPIISSLRTLVCRRHSSPGRVTSAQEGRWMRPAKVVGFSANGQATLHVTGDGREVRILGSTR